VFGLTNAQTDGAVGRRGGGAGKELFESLKRVGLQSAEQGVHRDDFIGQQGAVDL
jgi:hypothetical protein